MAQMIERKIEALEGDMAGTRVSNRRSSRWLNDHLLIELAPRLRADEIRGLFAPPPWGEEPPLSAFCRAGDGVEWESLRSIDMDVQARLMMQFHTARRSFPVQSLEEDEVVALNSWRRIDRHTREAIKRSFLPDLLQIYEGRVRGFVEDASDNSNADVLVLHVQDPFQRLLLHGVCEFYNVASETETMATAAGDGGDKPWKTTTIRRRPGTGAPSRITLVSYLRRKKNNGPLQPRHIHTTTSS